MATVAPHLLLVMILLFAASPSPSAVADEFVVGDRQQWTPNVDYTHWPDQYRFHVGDWLVFRYEKGMYDVVQVSEAAYAACDASNPIVSYSRGSSFAFELNHTGRYYFICSRGYCWGRMKVTVLVEPRSPPPSVAPSTTASRATSARAAPGDLWWALAASLGTAVLGLPFAA